MIQAIHVIVFIKGGILVKLEVNEAGESRDIKHAQTAHQFFISIREWPRLSVWAPRTAL
jgi:hypothetical protein